MIGSMSLRTPLAVLAATACVTGVALAVSDQARSVVDMAPVGVWFANDDADSVSHIGPAGTDATVEIPQPDGALRITELDGVAYVTDAEGHLSRIDPARLVVSQEVTLPSANTQLIAGGGRLYVVDHTTGTVRELDPQGLTTIGETSKLGDQLGAAVVDDDGVLWIPDRTTGSIVAVDGRNVTTGAQVARPGDDVQLSVVNGVVVALNPAASTVTEITPGGSAGSTHTVTVAPGATAPAAVGGVSVLPVVSGTNLITLDLRNGRTITIELADPDHRLGTPAITGDRVYVPDFTAGALLVVDLASRRVVDTLRVTGRSGAFELVVENGRVFVNDPASERAWTLNSAGALVPVAKYDPSRPGGGSGAGVVPPPAAPTTTQPDERDDRKEDPQDDEADGEDGGPPTTAPRTAEVTTTTRPPTTAPPVVVVPPPSKAPTPSTPSVTAPGNGGQGNGGGTAAPTTPRTSTGSVREVVAVPGDEAATVTWRPPENWRPVTGYRVVVEPTGASVELRPDQTSYTATGLRNGTATVFAITALSAEGPGETVRSVEVTPSAPRPDAPTDVVAVPGDASVTLTWQAPRRGQINGYAIDVMLADGTPALQSTAAPDQTRVTINGLANGTKYYATVSARTSDQRSAPTPSGVFMPTSAPGRPAGVSAANTGSGEITVSWSPGPDNGGQITGYTVSAPGLASQDVGGAQLSAVFNGLAIGSSYAFTVVATNRNGTGPGATSATVSVQSQVPGSAGSVVATPGDGSVTINWTEAPANGSTVIGYSVRNVTDGTPAATVPGSDRSTTVRGLANGRSYVFEIQALASNGAAGQPVSTTAVTPFGALTVPSGVVATATTPVSIDVTFDAPPHLNGNPIASWIVSTTPATTEQTVTTGAASITGLTQGTDYIVNVVAVTTAGALSNPGISGTVRTPFGIPDAVTGFRPTTQRLASVTLVWDAMPYAEWYIITPLGGGVMTPFRSDTTFLTYDPNAYYEEMWEVEIVAFSRFGSSVAVRTWVEMPLDPIDQCGGTTRKICP